MRLPLSLYGMARGWPLIVLAVLAGLGTAVRPVERRRRPRSFGMSWFSQTLVRGRRSGGSCC